jgi:hypothetical protein
MATEIEDTPLSKEPTTLHCPHCGTGPIKVIPGETAKCVECGKPLFVTLNSDWDATWILFPKPVEV